MLFRSHSRATACRRPCCPVSRLRMRCCGRSAWMDHPGHGGSGNTAACYSCCTREAARNANLACEHDASLLTVPKRRPRSSGPPRLLRRDRQRIRQRRAREAASSSASRRSSGPYWRPNPCPFCEMPPKRNGPARPARQSHPWRLNSPAAACAAVSPRAWRRGRRRMRRSPPPASGLPVRRDPRYPGRCDGRCWSSPADPG